MKFLAATVVGLCVYAQNAPVVSPRGVTNAITRQPAPSVVSPGGIIWIDGLNLGPETAVNAEGTPLPTKLADMEVLVNGTLAPLYSVSAARIVAVIPAATPQGLAQVVVRKGEQSTRPARIQVGAQPAVRTRGDKGFGEFDASGVSGTVTATGTGFPLGENAPALRGFVGGAPAKVRAARRDGAPGLQDIEIEVPPDAKPGDIVHIYSGQRPANVAALASRSSAGLSLLRFPQGTPELRNLMLADVAGGYAVATGARDDRGCFPAVVFDFARNEARRSGECLSTAIANAQTPLTAAADSNLMAALTGPPESATVVGRKVVLFDPSKTALSTVELPEAAATLAGAAGDFVAIVPGPPARTLLIDSETLAVSTPQPGTIGGGGGGGAPGVLPAATEIDLGDGIKTVLGISAFGPNTRAALVADNAETPTKAKVAVLNAQNEVTSRKDLPADWLPLVPFRPAAAGGGQQQFRVTVPLIYDGPTRLLYVMVRKGDSHALAVVPSTEDAARVVPLPDGWAIANCAPQIGVASLELTRRLALVGAAAPSAGIVTPCPAQGFLLVDLATQTVTAAPLPGAGQFNYTGGVQELNDFLFGSNTDPGRRNTSDTLYVLDGAVGAVNRMDLPSEISGFTGLAPVPQMNALIGIASKTNPGDAGFVLFDLEAVSARILPIPDGFTAAQIAGVFPATRKLVARAQKADGTQYVVYDLMTGDSTVVPNPEGVAFVGALPAATPGGGQPGGGGGPPGGGVPPGGGPGGGVPGAAAQVIAQRVSAGSNRIAAFAYDAQRRPVGIVLLSVN